ncbi:MAG: ATP-binding cassette domain-containing protein [Gemmatirosa sp.]
MSFRVAPGETLALVGHTGAGKTTVVSLLLRFYEPQRGRILLDGVDVRDLSLDALRSRIGFVQQDIFLFAGDVASNVRLGAPLTDAEVEAAAARVGADRVVERLPGGWRHALGERGASLSVGERQLLAFARAIAADPALLVLDEATSAVDSEAEERIQAALATLMRGRTNDRHRAPAVDDRRRGRHPRAPSRAGRGARAPRRAARTRGAVRAALPAADRAGRRSDPARRVTRRAVTGRARAVRPARVGPVPRLHPTGAPGSFDRPGPGRLLHGLPHGLRPRALVGGPDSGIAPAVRPPSTCPAPELPIFLVPTR